MISFLRRYWGRLSLILVLIIGSLALLFSSQATRRNMSNYIFTKTQRIFSPFTKGISSIQSTFTNEIEYHLRKRSMNREIILLQKENAELRNRIQNYRVQEIELHHLRQLLDLKKRIPFQLIAVDVIAVAPSNYYLTLIIGKGTNHGLKRNMVVMGEEGVIGRILQISPNSSKVLLIGDQRSSVAVILERNETRAILEGIGAGKCKLILEDPQVQVKIGDRVITSGLGGVFPKGLYIGTVDRIEKDSRSGWATLIRVKPASNNYTVQNALVIINPVFPEVNIKELEEK